MKELDLDTRKEYDTAVKTVPDLVRNESSATNFLVVEGNNPQRAAARMAKYWKSRKQVFGDDRWLLPMTQTGHGALSKTDIDILRSGYLVILTRPCGGIIALFDESKLSRELPKDTKMRLIFYFSSIFCQHAIRGKTIVHVVTSDPRPRMLPFPPMAEWQTRQSVMPGSGLIRPSIFVAQAYEQGKEELLDSMGYRTLRTEELNTQMPVERLAGNSVKDIVLLLERRGIERSLFPRCLGGDFDYRIFDDWIRQRLSIEGAMSAAPLHLNKAPAGASAVATTTTTPAPKAQQCSRVTP